MRARPAILSLVAIAAPLMLGQACPWTGAGGGLFGLFSADPGPNDGALQMVYVDFGNRTPDSFIHTINPNTITAPFSETNWLTGDPAEAAGQVMARLRTVFGPYNICLYSSYECERPQGMLSTVYVGVDPGAEYMCGRAASVDRGNRIVDDEAVVSTHSTADSEASCTSEEKLAYVANLIAHEMGHLLGLEQTADPGDIMQGCPWNPDAAFKATTISDSHSLFEGQWQDAPGILRRRVGGAAAEPCPADCAGGNAARVLPIG